MTKPDVTVPSAIPVDTYGGRIHVEWDPQAAVTPLGQLPFFIEFLKMADLFAPWVHACPPDVHEPQCTRECGPAWDALALGALGASSLRAHYDDSE